MDTVDMVADNKQVIRRYLEQDELGFPTPELVLSSSFVSHASSSDEVVETSSFLEWARALRDGLHPKVEVEDLIAEGDRVAVRVSWRGVHSGPFAGMAPTGREYRVSGIGIFRVAEGKVVERWLEFDQVGLMSQIKG